MYIKNETLVVCYRIKRILEKYNYIKKKKVNCTGYLTFVLYNFAVGSTID